MRRGAAWTLERHQAAAWSLPWSRSRWQSCHRRAGLGCQAANAAPTGGARRVLAGRLVVVAIEDVRTPSVPFVRSPSASPPVLPWRAGWSGRCPAEYDRAGGVRNPVRSWRPCGRRTRPRGHRTGTRLAAVPASSTGAGVTTDRVSMPVAVGVAEGACALPSCPVRARTCRPRGWPWPADRTHGRTLGAGGVRRRPDWVRTHRLGGHLELGMSGRPDAREVRHVRRPASQCRVSAGGTDRRRRCPGECPAAVPWRKRVPSLTAGMSGTPWRGPSGVTGRSRVRCGPTSGSGAEACDATDRADGGVWRRVGQWVSASNFRLSALAGRPGALLGGG